MLWRQVAAIHFVGQEHIATRFLERKAAREFQFAGRTFSILEHATISTFENYFACVWLRDRTIKQGRE